MAYNFIFRVNNRQLRRWVWIDMPSFQLNNIGHKLYDQ